MSTRKKVNFFKILINIQNIHCENMQRITAIFEETYPSMTKGRFIPIRSSCTQTFIYCIWNKESEKPRLRRTKTVYNGLCMDNS